MATGQPSPSATAFRMSTSTERITALDQKLEHKIITLDQRVDGLDGRVMIKLDAMKTELISEIRRVDTRIDAVERELHIAIDVRERLAALEACRTP